MTRKNNKNWKFFAKNKEKAKQYIKKVEKRENIKFSEPKLAKKQIPHMEKWKTWKVGLKRS